MLYERTAISKKPEETILNDLKALTKENKNIYFLLMTKCDVIANDIDVEEKKMICMKNKLKK